MENMHFTQDLWMILLILVQAVVLDLGEADN